MTLIDEFLTQLDAIKGRRLVSLIGHNKVRQIKSKLDTEDYYVVSSNLNFDYFNAFAYKCPIICNIIEDADVDEKVLKGKTRQMYFRDNAFVEAGSRFSEMPVKVPYGAKNYQEAVLEGIKSSIKMGNANIKEMTKEIKEEPKKVEPVKEQAPEPTPDFLKEEPKAEVKKTKKQAVTEVIEKAKQLTTDGVAQNQIMDVLTQAGFPNPNNIPDVKTAEEIIVELNKLG